VWSLSIGLPEITKLRWLDPMALMTVGNNIMAEARKAIPGYKNSFSFTIDLQPVQVAESLRYRGMHWTPDALLLRLLWVGVPLLIVLFAAVWFDRFAGSRASAIPRRRRRVHEEAVCDSSPSLSGQANTHLTPLSERAPVSAFRRLVVAELR